MSIDLVLPFFRYEGNDLVLLPGGKLVFEIVHHICFLHPETGKMAVIVQGWSPIVVIPKPEDPTDATGPELDVSTEDADDAPVGAQGAQRTPRP